MRKKYLCIHGHFYQPPRENPWIEAIELQESAAPDHDWNERINRECYLPNTAARVLNDEGQIIKIVNNYKYISFNFGPTLLSWMEKHAPRTYHGILEADRYSLDNLGHGNAIAQVYNHIIMPLATRRDKEIEVRWGIRDFEFRFGRKPEGMWLSETAVDTETLEVLAENGIRFTILSPYQAEAFRLPGEEWNYVNGDIDTTRPYLCNLPSGKSIVIWYYHSGISQAIAFEKLLVNGDFLYNRIRSAYSENHDSPQLINIATDGESYGHHFFHGEMALAYCLQKVKVEDEMEIINYAAYLEKYPPEHETKIREATSWSCAHGVGRWKENCGCNTGANPGWNQEWRAPLREALNVLSSQVDMYLQKEGNKIFNNIEQAVDDYISLILNGRSEESYQNFISTHFSSHGSDRDLNTGFLLLEMKRQALLTFTSCAWFFDDISGLEPVQILKYAARLIDLGEIADLPLPTGHFLSVLENARSNITEYGSGKDIFEKRVLPAKISLKKIYAHHAIHKIVDPGFADTEFYVYKIKTRFFRESNFNQMTLTASSKTIYCNITGKPFPFESITLHLSGLDFNVYVKYGDRGEEFENVVNEAFRLFEEQSLADLIRFLPHYFGDQYYVLNDLFKDDRYQIIDIVDKSSLEKLGSSFLDFFAENKKLFIQLSNANYPLPDLYVSVSKYALNYYFNDYLNKLIENNNGNQAEISYQIIQHIMLMKQWNIIPDKTVINQSVIPKLLKILNLVLEEKISTHNFLAILKEIAQLNNEIEWWALQDRVLAYIVKNSHSELTLQHDFWELCSFLKIKIRDFL